MAASQSRLRNARSTRAVSARTYRSQVARNEQINVGAALFGESASRVVVTAGPGDFTAVLERAAAAKVPARVIGETGGNRLRMAVGGAVVIDQPVDAAERVFGSAIERYFEKRVA